MYFSNHTDSYRPLPAPRVLSSALKTYNGDGVHQREVVRGKPEGGAQFFPLLRGGLDDLLGLDERDKCCLGYLFEHVRLEGLGGSF